ncbi:MAG: M28 family peptidase [Bacteroidota bacterium]
MKRHLFNFLFIVLPFTTSGQQKNEVLLALEIMEALSSPAMEGRKTNTKGNKKARIYLIEQFENLGHTVKTDTFNFRTITDQVEGINLMVEIKGSKYPQKYIVISAHYDHLGIKDKKIYNGADDNASGTAALLSLAATFKENSPLHSLILVAFDAEEMGLQGAKHFVKHPPINRKSIQLNINMDMISQSEKGELYVCGTHHYSFTKSIIQDVASSFSKIKILFGHDIPNTGSNDWTNQSDHYAFHKVKIPFIYFGVEDHSYYHKPTDTFDKLTKDFYLKAIQFITATVNQLDQELEKSKN